MNCAICLGISLDVEQGEYDKGVWKPDSSKTQIIIKNSVNYASSFRGDLGALQNRVEHTGNNMSVMDRNIRDAKSTDRDTDVANEMMSYAKNTILVQSVQARLHRRIRYYRAYANYWDN